jgi:hypothetical protein
MDPCLSSGEGVVVVVVVIGLVPEIEPMAAFPPMIDAFEKHVFVVTL